MNIHISERPSSDRHKVYYTLNWGRKSGQRLATGIFTYAKPANQLQRNHNKEALTILETKRSQMVIEMRVVMGMA
ncbi:MAG TPA: hypothetical protein VGM30_20490 [Puia sp.]|jgi:hypothetical protein